MHETVHLVERHIKQKDWDFIAEQPAPAPHLAHPEGRAAQRIVLDTVPRDSRSGHLAPNAKFTRVNLIRSMVC